MHKNEMDEKGLKELCEIFRRNFPFIVRDDKTVRNILGQEKNKIIDRRNEQKELIGVSVINENAILLFCVDKAYRNKGIGTELLAQSEDWIKKEGHSEVTVGVGFDYLMPGVPTSKRYYDAVNEKLYDNMDEVASDFFTKRGYVHSWDCNCFDMKFPLKDFCKEEHSVGDTIDGIHYRWANRADLEEICRCTEDAYEEFTQWYQDEKLYEEGNSQRILIATNGDEIVGTLIVSNETEGENLGSIGCTTVRHSCRGRHVGVNLVTLGTKYLRDVGLKEAFLSYTYTGLDYMYGCAGYKVCIYYMKAKKAL